MMGNIEKILGHRFKLLRQRAGLSQKEIADRVKSSESTVFKFEKGVHLPHNLDEMLAEVKVDTETFLGTNSAELEELEKAELLLGIIKILPTLYNNELDDIISLARKFAASRSPASSEKIR